MGADLYITKIDKDKQLKHVFEVSDKAVEDGYFRDCYNNMGLFAVMSKNLDITLSWWRLSDTAGWFSRNNPRLMTLSGVKKWRAYLLPKIEKFKSKDTLVIDTLSLSEGDVKEYHRWADILLKFIDLAIAKKSTVAWSV